MTSQLTILLIEDHELVRVTLRCLLEGGGYRVTCAADGREALDLLRTAELPSLILLDLVMPVLDGCGFLREQQLDPSIAAIPVLVVTASDVERHPDAAGHLQKPFRSRQLLDAVRSCLLRHLA